MNKTLKDKTIELETEENAKGRTVLKTKAVEYPDGRVSKKTGEKLYIKYYFIGDEEIQTTDVIGLDSGERWRKDDLTPAEMKEVKTIKGDETLRKAMLNCHTFAKGIRNAAKNGGIVVEEAKVEATCNFIRVQVEEALQMLSGTKQDDGITLPF